MKQVIFRHDFNSYIASAVELKPFLCTKLDDNIGVMLTKQDYYFDSKTFKFRKTNAVYGQGFFIVVYRNKYAFSQGMIKEDDYKKYVEMTEKANVTETIEKWLTEGLTDFSDMSDAEIKSFVIEKQKEHETKQQAKKQQRVREQEAREQKKREKQETYIKDVIQDFINNKSISGEDLKEIIKKYKKVLTN